MYFDPYDSHDPFHPPEPWRSQFLLEGYKYEDVRQEGTYQIPGAIGDVTPTLDEWMALASMKDGNTACVDDRVGRFVAALRDVGVLDRTVFIITGDHGDCIGHRTVSCMDATAGVFRARRSDRRVPGIWWPRGSRPSARPSVIPSEA